MANNTTSSKAPIERLDFSACFFFRTNINGGIQDRSENQVQFYCKSHGLLLFGEEAEKASLVILGAFIILLGIFGTISNIWNIIVLGKSFSGRPHFKESLVLLALVELTLSFVSAGYTLFLLLIFGNIDRSQLTMILFLSLKNAYNITRSLSVLLTVLITIERYIVVASPLKSKLWLESTTHPWKARVPIITVICLSILLNIVWIIKTNLEVNPYYSGNHNDLEELRRFPYLIKRNEYVGREVQYFLLVVDYLLPFPVLLIFTCLLYRSIHKWKVVTSSLTGTQKRDINAAKMFSVVVAVSFVCHLVSCSVLITSRIFNLIYVELFLLQIASVVVSASTNFVVYYWFGPGFQREFLKMVKRSGCTRGKLEERINERIKLQRKTTSTFSQASQQDA